MEPAGGRQMIYPYTLFGKLARFNYRYRWHNDRMLRFRFYVLPIAAYLAWNIQKAMIGDEANKELWKQLRAKRRNGWFDPVKE